MDKIWNFIIDIAIALILMFLGVAIYFGLKTEIVMKTVTSDITEDFLTEVKEGGSLTLRGYEDYMERLALTDSLYDITFEHRYKIVEPEYRFRTLEEIIAAQNAAYTGPNDYHYRDIITEKPNVEDPINNGNLNTETNESVLAKAVDTPSDPNHVHTEECYSGHRHSGNGYFIHTHKHSWSCVEYTGLIYTEFDCGNCGIHTKKFLAYYEWDPVAGRAKLVNSDGGIARCLNCGGTNLLNSAMHYGYDYSCGYNIDLNKDGYNDAVGTTQAYEYKRSTPQDTSVRQTAVNGCYKYHNHVTFPVGGHDYYGNPVYTYSSISEAASKGWYAYCSMPEYYRVSWQSSSGSGMFRITYKVVENSNGTISFVFSSSYASSYGNPRVPFPQTMTLSDFAGLLNKWTAEGFWERYYEIEFGDFSNDYSMSLDCTGNISRCNETIHNRWYTTCGLEEDGDIACNQMVVNLIPTHTRQTIYTNDRLITTAVATYRDGSKKTIVCTTTFSTANVVIDAPVTLVYSYSILGKNFSNTCQITVSVIRRNKTCVNGHTYNLNNDGSDPGCPFCRSWVRNLRVTHPATSTFTITIGTTLQDNGVTILVTYMDGHTETITSGYIDNLDKGYLGTKLVTIGYKGATTSLMITTVRARITCDICGFEYELYQDGTSPGCPRCISKTPVFTGNIMEYERIENTESILETLYEGGEYPMNKNDVFTVNLSNKSSNIARKLLGRYFPSLTDRWMVLRKSGRVKTY